MPTKSTRQTHMDVFMGKAPNVDDNHQIDDISFKRNVLTKTASYTVLPKESGSLFVTSGSANQTFTLPPAADGLEYEFFHAGTDDTTMAISSTGNNIVGIDGLDFQTATLSATGTGTDLGGSIDVISDGTSWFARASSAAIVLFAT